MFNFLLQATQTLTKKNCYKLYLIVGFFSVVACEEIVKPELITAEPAPVVDAQLTNQVNENYVLLSQTNAFNDSTSPPPLEGAEVIVFDQLDRAEVLIEATPGRYIPSPNFSGTVGNQYRLRVRTGDNTYEAIALMSRAALLDSVTYTLREDDFFFEDGYYLSAHFQDLPGRSFFLWELIINGKQINERDILINNDENLDGQYLDFEIGFSIPLESVETGDTLGLRMFNLSSAAFRYYSGLIQLTNTGSPSEVIPENPPTNLSNGALGFFRVASIDTAFVIVE